MIAGKRRASRRQAWLVAMTALLGASPDCARRASEAHRPASAPVGSQGFRVYRDPSTGAFVEPLPGVTVAAPAARAAAPSAFSEQAAPGGGLDRKSVV